MAEPEGPPARSASAPQSVADDDESLEDLAEQIRSGSLKFDFNYKDDLDAGGGPQWISINWDGGVRADWVQDIGNSPDLSPASSAPAYGWASWMNGRDVLQAYYSNDMGVEGWARAPGAAPTNDEDPGSWVLLGRAISAAVSGHYANWPGMQGAQYF